ncbi:MAG TPA: tetratricopeptide repeat protein [Gemmataceae bacterium]|jgi:tetratricopeptide (TPR) repeat protein|nr:tetratricopeptide repeat protein [Gemmataceae bacterium]
MKAEHRKELHTNLLADRMGRLIKNVKSGSRSTSATTWAIVGIGLATIVGWYIANLFKEKQTSPWVQLETTPDVGSLGNEGFLQTIRNYNQIIQDYPGTTAARTARFQKARLMLQKGLTTYYSTNTHGQALDDLEKARELYKELVPECKNLAFLEEEAILGLAMAEESLVGIPKKDGDESRGNLDEALKWYEKLVKDYPDSFQGQRAKKRLEDIKDNRPQIEGLLAELNKLSGPIK